MFTYDVFISCDVCERGLARGLREALIQMGIIAFINNVRGDEISPELVFAIEKSKLSLVILTKNYTSSRCCLNELVKIMECNERYGQIMIPVFYLTNPLQVQHQLERYGDAFAKHNLSDLERMQKWGKAFSKAATIPGWHRSDFRNNFRNNLNTVRKWINNLPEEAIELGLRSSYVSPSEVRLPIYDRYVGSNLNTVRKWINTLSEEAIEFGLLSRYFRTDSEFIAAIATYVKISLDDSDTVDKSLIGIDEDIARVESMLCNESANVRTIGIWGMGGIGKTTIARAVFRKLNRQYESSCFVANVREECENYGGFRSVLPRVLSRLSSVREERQKYRDLDPLRYKLLSMLSYGTFGGIARFDADRTFMKKMIHSKKVLIVLDDVNDSEQLKYLAGEKDQFGPGSRIIVTSRGKGILSEADEIYEVKEMEFPHACQLFSRNAFKQIHPPADFFELSEWVVSYTKGIPLALKVLGSILYGKTLEEWKSTLHSLARDPVVQIQEVLRLSYDELDDTEKNIFLDIACFYKGEDINRVKILLDGSYLCADIGLFTLFNKSLITTSSDNKVLMHDMIQEMGQEIVRQESHKIPWKRSRLWDPRDICETLKGMQDTYKIEGMSLDMSKIEDVYLRPDIFNEMDALRLLKFHNSLNERCKVHLSKGLQYLPNQLRLLHWEQYPLKSLPATYSPENLIELNLFHSQIEKLWDEVKILVNLISVNLSFSKYLIELPDLAMATNLKSINLRGCTSLLHVSSSIFNLNKLTTLDLGGCKMLESLQSDCHSTSLEMLSLSGCSNLRKFLVTSENMKCLNLGGTAIEELPPSIGCNRKLTELILVSCPHLENLPNSFSNLSCLETLNLSDCPKVGLDKLSPAFDGLKSLKRLYMDNCFGLTKLPSNISRSSSLNSLILSGSNIKILPASIKDLCQLKIVLLKDCRRLEYLPQLPSSIQRLNASGCVSLKTVLSPLFLNKKDILRSYQGAYSQEYVFYNCIRLSQNARRRILEEAWSRILRVAYLSSSYKLYGVDNILVTICLPWSEEPNWFYPQGLTSLVTFPLREPPPFGLKALRFAFYLVLDASTSKAGKADGTHVLSIGCKCYLEESCGKRRRLDYSSELYQTQPGICRSDHVFLWYDDLFCREIMSEAEKECNAYGGTQYSKVTFEFYGRINGADRVKKCGAWLLK